MRKIIITQFVILLCGTLFAWGNFGYELYNWLDQKPCETGCIAYTPTANPFFTPCFFGAIFFTIACILSSMLLKKPEITNSFGNKKAVD